MNKQKKAITVFFLATSVFAQAQVTTFGNGAGTGGSGNAFYGENAGHSNTGTNNTYMGHYAGASFVSGNQNTFLGNEAGRYANNTSANTVIGSNAGKNLSGFYNTLIGVQAGANTTSGQSNVMLGTNAGGSNTSGTGNFFLGDNSGGNNTTGGYNVYIGVNSGNGSGVNGNNNIAIGFESGYANVNGSNNSFIGFRANAGASDLSNAMAIGSNAVVSQSNSLVLGAPGVKVGIGVSRPQYALTVEGEVGARSVNVTPETWSDFVFEKTYKLPSLVSVERSIQRDGHLPNIPSAQQVETSGIELGQMQAKLLQKIEELTLYAIQQHKTIKHLTALTSLQQKQLVRIKKELADKKKL